MTSPVD